MTDEELEQIKTELDELKAAYKERILNGEDSVSSNGVSVKYHSLSDMYEAIKRYEQIIKENNGGVNIIPITFGS